MSKKSEANAKLRTAQKALNDNAARERKAGIRDETPEYQRLNTAVNDAVKDVSWWRRQGPPAV